MSGIPEAEPTIKDVFLAVTKSNTTLTTLLEHVGKVQAGISFIRQDLQTVRERLSSAGRYRTAFANRRQEECCAYCYLDAED